MASYKSGFDPPPRSAQVDTRDRRLGTYIEPMTGRQDDREAEAQHMTGKVEQRIGYNQPHGGKLGQTGLPRPSMRSASPAAPGVMISSYIGTVSSSGYGRAPSNTSTSVRQPASILSGKSSRNVLRRKQSSVGQYDPASRPQTQNSGSASPSKWSQMSAENRPSIDASLKSAEAYNEIFTIPRTKTPVTADVPRIIPELDRYRLNPNQNIPYGNADIPHKLSTTDLPPPTPQLSGTPLYSGSSSSHHRYSGYSGSGYSISPSTRFSESPGPGAFYSRNTTPTSTASQSPGLVVPLKPMTPRLKQGSPAHSRPPVTRRRATSNANETEGTIVDPHGLSSLREASLTSSSSNSTVKGEKKPEMREKKKKGLSPLPPSPPPRKSSQKFKNPRSSPQESPSKSSQAPADPVMVSPVKSMPSARQNTMSPAQKKMVPPTRPSRDGAPDLRSQLGESMAVIQSNLAGLTFPQDEKPNVLQRKAPSPLLLPRSAQGTRLPSRNPSPSPIQPSPRLGTPAPAGLGITPDLKPRQPPASAVAGLRTPSPNTVTQRPRFGLFGRRAKTAPEVPTVEAIREKAARKGPAAGTGHEGYGRYAFRGRSTSVGVLGRAHESERSTSVARSSQESVSSTRTHDPFLLERMSPVIIAGGEVIENRNTSSELTRTESNTSILLGTPSIESSKGSSKSGLSQEMSRNTLWPSSLPKQPTKRSSTLPAPNVRRPSDSSDDGFGKASTAFRRSIQRMNNSSSALHIPKPLDAGASMTSLDASILSDESLEVTGIGRGRKGQIHKSKKLEKRPRSPRKWNIFHRSIPKPESKPEAAVSVTVGRPPVKPIPHYALLDSSDEMLDYMEDMDLEDILRDAEVIDLSNEELDVLQFGKMAENLKREKEAMLKAAKAKEERLPPLLFSSPAPEQNKTPEVFSAEVQLSREEAQPRPSRLPQVGRIPKVISARPQATSPKSFSRPFARLSTIQPVQEPVMLDEQSVALGASPPKSSLPGFSRTNLQDDINASLRLSSAGSGLEGTNTGFLEFSPRAGSEATTSSNSVSFTGVNALIPDTTAVFVDDEVWDEYDDLIENDDGTKVPLSATSSQGVPFQYESYESRRIRKSKMHYKESPTLASFAKIPDPAEGSGPPRKSFVTTSSVYSADMDPRLKDSLAAITTPTTPMSFTDFFSGYGDRNNSVHGDSARKPRRSSRSSSRKSTSSSNHSRSISGLVTITEQENTTPISEVNLRVGSMTVSKWLTFGHVLFSPARDSMGLPKRHSVLVIDGLGNDDWSFYAAETYPSATFYNLSPTRPLSSSHRYSATLSAFPLTPPNHRQIEHASPALKFPFPSSTFHVVVFRFPPSLQLPTYQHIISEAKRVLLPGGFLELAILDLDMNNMGPRARRAVRGLKMRMQGSAEDVWTGSASDTVLKLIGKRGFDSVKSCCVGVPVATSIPSSSSISTTSNTRAQLSTSALTSTTTSTAAYQEEKSLADLIKDPSRESDEGITKMVARVGRWWYTRCYEGGIGNGESGSGSIFDDETLVRESEEWNASFKLLVAHARKPLIARRRALSA